MKKSNTKNRETLDVLHLRKIKEIDSKEKNLPELRLNLEDLKNQYSKLVSEDNYISLLSEKIVLEEKINDLEQKISNIEKMRENYFLDTSHILFQYYDNKKNISQGDDQKRKVQHKIQSQNKTRNSIIDFFVSKLIV